MKRIRTNIAPCCPDIFTSFTYRTRDRNSKKWDDVVLRAILKGLMEGEGFHDFLIEGANDRLHLKAFENGLFLEAADLNATPLFPLGAKKFFEAGDKSEGWPDWMNKWMWGMANSPLELIAYIVKMIDPTRKW